MFMVSINCLLYIMQNPFTCSFFTEGYSVIYAQNMYVHFDVMLFVSCLHSCQLTAYINIMYYLLIKIILYLQVASVHQALILTMALYHYCARNSGRVDFGSCEFKKST